MPRFEDVWSPSIDEKRRNVKPLPRPLAPLPPRRLGLSPPRRQAPGRVSPRVGERHPGWRKAQAKPMTSWPKFGENAAGAELFRGDTVRGVREGGPARHAVPPVELLRPGRPRAKAYVGEEVGCECGNGHGGQSGHPIMPPSPRGPSYHPPPFAHLTYTHDYAKQPVYPDMSQRASRNSPMNPSPHQFTCTAETPSPVSPHVHFDFSIPVQPMPPLPHQQPSRTPLSFHRVPANHSEGLANYDSRTDHQTLHPPYPGESKEAYLSRIASLANALWHSDHSLRPFPGERETDYLWRMRLLPSSLRPSERESRLRWEELEGNFKPEMGEEFDEYAQRIGGECGGMRERWEEYEGRFRPREGEAKREFEGRMRAENAGLLELGEAGRRWEVARKKGEKK